MKFLVDECCPAPVVHALRAAMHDVVSIAEVSASVPDLKVLELAQREQRILITEDKDFGDHVIRGGASVAGVVLLRLPRVRGADAAVRVMHVIEQLGEQIIGKYVVILRNRVRLRALIEGD